MNLMKSLKYLSVIAFRLQQKVQHDCLMNKKIYIVQLYYNYIMTMSDAQVRLPNGLIEEVDKLVGKGMYATKSDAIRDAVRRLVLSSQVGSVKNTGNSVKEIRKIRKKLSKEKVNLDEINKLAE